MNYLNQLLIAKVIIPVAAGNEGQNFLSKTTDWLGQAILIFGAVWAGLGAMKLSTALKEHNGQDMRDSLFQLLGGAIACAVGVMFGALDVTFN